MAKQLSDKERARRARQSREANPRKYRDACLRKGCCANCAKNIEARAQYTGSGTVFSQYFTGAVPGFGGTRTYRKCAATGEQILNDSNRCNYYERANGTASTSEVVSTALGTR